MTCGAAPAASPGPRRRRGGEKKPGGRGGKNVPRPSGEAAWFDFFSFLFFFFPFGWSPQVTFPFQLHLGNKGRRDPRGGRARNILKRPASLHLRGGQRNVGSGGEKGRGRDLDPAPAPDPTHAAPALPASAAQADVHILFKCHISFDPGQRFSMCLAQLLPSLPLPPLTPLCVFSWRSLPVLPASGRP